MYPKLCVYFYVKRKEECLRLAVNYNSVLNKIFNPLPRIKYHLLFAGINSPFSSR